MRPIGFSTGALAAGDFRGALRMLEGTTADVVELSALRLSELGPLADAAGSLPLREFEHVSVHAPSCFSIAEEPEIVRILEGLTGRGWLIVAHPDAIHRVDLWRQLGSSLLIENMDNRKHLGRSAEELREIFDQLPEAGLCLDLAHARQFDPTMIEAHRILHHFGDRIRLVHMSEVSSASRHTALSYGAILDYLEVAHRIPANVPVVLESPVPRELIDREIELAREAIFESSAILI